MTKQRLFWSCWLLASVTLIVLTIINILGVRSGSNTQSALMILKGSK